jgi:selenide,water dikinase
LAQVLRRLPVAQDARVLVGYDTADDAGVYKIRDDLALVQTVDFFTPIVDDPYDFGRIAAANALSDIYAMGARPITALNVAAFPVDTLDLRVLERILEGGAQVAAAAGVAILGGHTIKDSEPKYGMAVLGTVDPSRIVTNANARPGDILILTKPLGTGILSTALKAGEIGESAMTDAVNWMTALNESASTAMVAAGAHAATDVTGFGLLGHAGEMARASHVRLVIDAWSVPLMPGVLELAQRDVVPGGTRDNAAAHAQFTVFQDAVTPAMRLVLSDAQTSGGLLIALPPDAGERFAKRLDSAYGLAAVIGRVEQGAGISVMRTQC